MSLPGWCWLLLTLRLSASDRLEVYEHGNHEVVCSQGLSECVVKDVLPLSGEVDDAVQIQRLTPHVKLCCNDTVALCTLCLVVDTEVSVDLNDEDGDYSGNEESANPKASVRLCYQTASVLPTCKKVEFTLSLTQNTVAKVFTVIIRQHGFSFGDTLRIYTFSNPSFIQSVVVPRLNQVCHQDLQGHAANCYVPGINAVINDEAKSVELTFPETIESVPSVCIQYEKNGVCQSWNRTELPLQSVAPCMCFQVWYDVAERPMRSLRCPFIDDDGFKRNMRHNVSVYVSLGLLKDDRTVLLWNLSAPCRLEGEVWPCQKTDSCRELPGFRQQLDNWSQNSKGLWVTKGIFEDIDLQLSPCVMLTVEGRDLGEFCFRNTLRHRWNLLVLGVLLLVCFTGLIFYFLQGYIKKWVWSWNHGGFIKLHVNKKVHVLLLSPPDVDTGVSGLVDGLGLNLQNHGFNVSVEQWSRMEQCDLGPLPWLYSKLLKPNSRVVLILTHGALEKADVLQKLSPYTDVFMGSLCIIEKEKQLARVHQRFILVTFDTHLGSCKNLPTLLQGLPLFQLPSQAHELLAELTVRGTEKSCERTQTNVEV